MADLQGRFGGQKLLPMSSVNFFKNFFGCDLLSTAKRQENGNQELQGYN